MNQKLASIILENNAFEITLAKNGKEVIRILKEQRFDLILMDYYTLLNAGRGVTIMPKRRTDIILNQIPA